MTYVSWMIWPLFVAVVLAWFVKVLFSARQTKLPPGLRGFDTLRFLVKCLRNGFDLETSILMRELNTDLISLDLFGWKTFIVFGSVQKLTEAYQKKGELLLKRPANPVKPDTIGLLNGHGPQWREQRRFALTTLRNLGMGKHSVEMRILDEVQQLLCVMKEKNGCPFSPMTPIGTAVLNVISSVIFNSKFEHGDPDLVVMLENFNNLASGSQTRSLITLSMFESFFKLPGIKSKIIEQRMKTEMARRIMQRRIKLAQKSGVDEQNVDDFVDAYMLEMKRRQEETESSFTESQMVDAVEDLFGAGSETTSTTLRWALFFMASYPDVQERVFAELHDKIGTERLPKFSDREHTPYTEAVILEVQRYGSLVPLIRRLNQEPLDLFGYTLEAGTNFIANLWHMNRDRSVWERAEEFYPGHFYDESGRVINREKFNPFGLGKRQCIGESLAKMELYLFFTAFILNFKFLPPEGGSFPGINEASVGMVRAPVCYEICAIKR